MSPTLALLALGLAGQDLDALLANADRILEETKAAYEEARAKNAAIGFVDAGFRLEGARIKYLVLQEIGSPEQQKTAADRLRAVSQLNKLLQHGRLALSGASEEKAAKPAPEDPPAVTVVLLPVPDAAKQREAEKLIRDLFRDQYAKRGIAERRELSKTLLEQARKTGDDATARWVLYREAQELAVLAGDIRGAISAADEAALVFDMDPMPAKSAALSAAAKGARSAEEFAALAEALLKLADEHAAADQYEAADKAMIAAVQHSKKGGDLPLATRIAARAKEISEAKSRFQSMKRVLETLARNADDPAGNLEVGQYLAFVKGNWDLGLRFLAKGSDATLKGLAEKELGFPTAPAELTALADGWWELAEKEKSAPRKGPLIAQAMKRYELALAGATGLLRAKIEKRLNDYEDARASGIDLLRSVDPAKDALAGAWVRQDGQLLTPVQPGSWARLQFPYAAPAEYDVAFTVRAVDAYIGIRLGLPLGGERQCMAVIGGEEGRAAGLEMIDQRSWNDSNPTYRPMPAAGRSIVIVCSLRKTGLTIHVDGKKLVDWKEPERLSNFGGWATPQRNAFFLASSSPRVAVTRVLLTPISGQGKRLR